MPDCRSTIKQKEHKRPHKKYGMGCASLQAMQPDLVLKFPEIYRSFCYGWFRNGTYLYIGKTTRGFNRLDGHRVIGKVDKLTLADELHLWYAPSLVELSKLERKLIEYYHPYYQTKEGIEKRGLFVRGFRTPREEKRFYPKRYKHLPRENIFVQFLA